MPWRRIGGVEVSGELHGPAALSPRERAPGTHWIGGWIVPRAGLDAVSKRKIPSLRPKSNPDHPIVQSVASRYTGWAIHSCVLCSVFCLAYSSQVSQIGTEFGIQLSFIKISGLLTIGQIFSEECSYRSLVSKFVGLIYSFVHYITPVVQALLCVKKFIVSSYRILWEYFIGMVL
jgi:hypothetical protein